jgi:hypothetical protein
MDSQKEHNRTKVKAAIPLYMKTALSKRDVKLGTEGEQSKIAIMN